MINILASIKKTDVQIEIIQKLFVVIPAMIMFYFLDHKANPIIFVLDFIICLEFSKMLYLMITGIKMPLFIRYVLASVIVSLVKYFYIAVQVFNQEQIIVYGLAIAFFVVVRWLAILSTKSDETNR